MTLRVADRLGIRGEALQHIHRGALLHDIGKMGIPDSILLKPGPLTPSEWEIMRQHPVHAYEMLKTIDYLRPALEIPYCHHERWDGNGYPRGLEGTNIPLSARIFAVVDVWDALTSDRPYRLAWPEPKALEYIKLESGRHFDSEVVNVFFSQ
jgi:HD-GYP domain-containing protein (c-di-GMP phosphodiesterase class II)